MRDRSKLYAEEISNLAIRAMIIAGELDDPRGVTRVFKHRYSGGQCDWGYIDQGGDYWAWYGGEQAVAVDEDELDELDIIDEWPMSYIDKADEE